MIAQTIDVVLLQTLFKRLNIYTGQVDGIFGPETSKALLKYRRAINIPENKDFPDSITKQVLDSAKEHLKEIQLEDERRKMEPDTKFDPFKNGRP